jgi:hypothetical protein
MHVFSFSNTFCMFYLFRNTYESNESNSLENFRVKICLRIRIRIGQKTLVISTGIICNLIFC